MSEKISAMPAATEMANADILPIVQTALNKSVTKQLLLTAASSEVIELKQGTTKLTFLPGGDTLLTMTSGATVDVFDGTTHFFQIDPAGGVQVVAANAQELLLQGGTGSEIIISAADVISIAAVPGGSIEISVQSGTAGLTLGAAGQVDLTSSAGNQLNITSGAAVVITADLGMSLTVGAGQVLSVQYTAATPAYWSGSPPADVWSALERIANVVSAGGTAPIP